MMKYFVLLTSFICCSILQAHSQVFEGTIRYEVSYMNLTKEMQDMLPDNNSESLFSIKGTKTKMEMDMMGSKMIIIFDIETNTSTSYTDVMGQKIKSTTAIEDEWELEIELVDSETKKIAGYLCKKAIMKQADMPDVEVYYTEDLKSNAWSSMNPQFKKLKGIPLEYQIRQQGMTMMSKAIEVTKKILNNSVFDPPAGNYKNAPAAPKY